MAYGEYYYKVDRQGRTILPSTLRHKVEGTIMLTYCSEDRYIGGYPSEVARQLSDGKRHIQHAGCDIFAQPLDSRGRFAIPVKLREYAEIETVIVIVAADDYFELWGEKYWGLAKIEAYAGAVALFGSQDVDGQR